jgi:endonuclease/exonuclease/phosphatase family metal-dependent hydrolase
MMLMHNIGGIYQGLVKLLSKNRWAIKILGRSGCRVPEQKRGMILIQIDGLSFDQFKKAIDQHRLPFLKTLLKNYSYTLSPVYSGLPSTTPAFQGELFYGIKSCVPAFEFIDRKKRQRHICFYPQTANLLADQLKTRGKPLLSGGHAYSTLFSGGAKKARYCSETMDLDSLLKSLHPFKMVLLWLIHITKLFRLIGFTAIEVILAVVDFFRGIVDRRNIIRELVFIPSRILICIVLRELIRFRMKIDIAEGIPILCTNFLGYDEQAHRRGPDSAFARWSLKGIDDVIKDIYKTALNTDCISYRMIIYSDHGQESVKSYDSIFNSPVKQAIRLALDGYLPSSTKQNSTHSDLFLERIYKRVRSLLLTPSDRKRRPSSLPDITSGDLEITTMGPLGHVYLPDGMLSNDLAVLAKILVQTAHIPLALFSENKTIMAVNRQGIFRLKDHSIEILGKDHPFLNQAVEDLERVCRHPHAGDIVISGWEPGQKPISFNCENGAHGGPGFSETRGFALIPGSVATAKPYFRALDLRHMVQRYFGKINTVCDMSLDNPEKPVLKIMSHNIHSCRNMNGRFNPNRTARLIEKLSPDIAVLQEVDVHQKRSGFIHQADYLADYLNMTYRFFPLMDQARGKYGLAILSRFPIKDFECFQFPMERAGKNREPRGMMVAGMDTCLGPVRIFNTHLGLNARDRRLQVMYLLKQINIIDQKEPGIPIVLCGDFNSGPGSFVYKAISRHLEDVQVSKTNDTVPRPTFLSWYPFRRIDHVFVSHHIIPQRVQIPSDFETRMVSDHLPVFSEFVLNNGNPTGKSNEQTKHLFPV